MHKPKTKAKPGLKREVVTQICNKMNIVNDPKAGIAEADLWVSMLRFADDVGCVHEVEATQHNRTGRLYIQRLMAAQQRRKHISNGQLSLTPTIKKKLAEYFGKFWDRCHLDSRALIYGLKHFPNVTVICKSA